MSKKDYVVAEKEAAELENSSTRRKNDVAAVIEALAEKGIVGQDVGHCGAVVYINGERIFVYKTDCKVEVKISGVSKFISIELAIKIILELA